MCIWCLSFVLSVFQTMFCSWRQTENNSGTDDRPLRNNSYKSHGWLACCLCSSKPHKLLCNVWLVLVFVQSPPRNQRPVFYLPLRQFKCATQSLILLDVVFSCNSGGVICFAIAIFVFIQQTRLQTIFLLKQSPEQDKDMFLDCIANFQDIWFCCMESKHQRPFPLLLGHSS